MHKVPYANKSFSLRHLVISHIFAHILIFVLQLHLLKMDKNFSMFVCLILIKINSIIYCRSKRFWTKMPYSVCHWHFDPAKISKILPKVSWNTRGEILVSGKTMTKFQQLCLYQKIKWAKACSQGKKCCRDFIHILISSSEQDGLVHTADWK